ncbi:hypothetical protein LL06_23235 [Hoeflea sp. BAL378]|uniref:hypothetical protein n=1 Tax=Hoeflea sp. BAL378 TaxID=1547437 RepID=UPI0005130EAF|nr:hypothetical protein [Hoeflea sp. BAL378]KGF67323.1 hypothetical protein LL06_23235 [Hoeflea sp. BAL378]
MLRLLDARFAGNAYAIEIDAALPRILALADRDPLSLTRGFGDRRFWAWKLADFANGTLQGPVNGLSRLLEIGAFGPRVDPERIRTLIGSMLEATPRLMRLDGSFEEALPYEQSYCVTALVLYDHLCAVERLAGPDDAWAREQSAALAPAAAFLVRRDETHGFISNHLATAAAALLRWDRLHGDAAARAKAEELISRILDRKSPEGWFEEYGGADPGYQTLCMTHLADAAEILESPPLWEALDRGARFLCHFAHPDGSFGGIYGSRATRIYYPAAMELLASRFAQAGALACWMRPAIARQAPVTLSAIDTPNLPPVFNNYCQALAVAPGVDPSVPPSPAEPGRHYLPEAGLLADIGPTHHSVISTRKAVICHWRDAHMVLNDTGLVLKSASGKHLTSQGDPATTAELTGERLVLRGGLTERSMPLPNPYNVLILRLLSVSVMRIPAIGALVKKLIAGLLVRSGGRAAGRFSRTIELGPALAVTDRWEPAHLERVSVEEPFSVIHMASSGYWQRGDTEGPQR